MDSHNDSSELEQIYRLLSLCARTKGHPVFHARLEQQVQVFSAWDELPAQAELHGMSSLLLYHLRQAHIPIPRKTERTLQGLYLRCRANNRIHERVLMETIELLGRKGIQPLVLKGLPLAYLYYPEPELRPASDIDLLLPAENFLLAQRLLEQTGYTLDPPSRSGKRLTKSIAAYVRCEGIRAMVELHRYDPKVKYEKGNVPDPEFAGLDSRPQVVEMRTGIVRTPGPTETLLYLMRHLTKHLFIANSAHPVQCKWIADIIGLIERQAGDLDWPCLLQNHRDIIGRLELFYGLTPLPESCIQFLPLRPFSPPRGLNQYPPGWPHQSIYEWKREGFPRSIGRLFVPPSEWWTCLYYGAGPEAAFWLRQVGYRMQVLSAMFWAFAHRAGFSS